MKRTMPLVLLLTASCLICSCAKFSVTRIPHTEEAIDSLHSGFAYILPKMVINFSIPFKSVKTTKNNCYEEAMKDTIIKAIVPAITKDTTKHTLVESKITLQSKALPDYQKYFFVSFNKHLGRDQSFTGKLNEIGLLSEAQFEQTDNTVELLSQVVTSASSLITGLGSKSGTDNNKTNSCQALIQNFKTTVQAKFNLIAGNPNGVSVMSYNEAVFNKQLEKLSEMEAALISSLTYSTEEKEFFLSVDVDPDILKDNTEVPFFYFTKDKGQIHINEKLLDTTKVTKLGTRVVLTKEDGFKNGKEEVYYLKLVDVYPTEAIVLKNQRFANPKGFAYNIPATRRVVLYKRKNKSDSPNNILSEEIKVPQLGIVGYLGKNLSKLSFTLHPTLGSIQSVAVESKGLKVSDVKNLETAISGLKKEPADTEEEKQAKETKKRIENLTNKKTILTLQKEIQTLEKEKTKSEENN